MKEAKLMVDTHVAKACDQNKSYNLEQNWKLKTAQWLLYTELIMALWFIQPFEIAAIRLTGSILKWNLSKSYLKIIDLLSQL